MSRNNITMKDIAEEAGVSVATVSYVLNYSDKEKISHDTRLKILDIAKKLNYSPNIAAKALTKKIAQKQIGIIHSFECLQNISNRLESYNLIYHIQKYAYSQGYSLIDIPAEIFDPNPKKIQDYPFNAIILIGVNEAFIKTISPLVYIPILVIDCFCENPLFSKVLSDQKSLLELSEEYFQNDFDILIDDTYNTYYLNELYRLYDKNKIIRVSCGGGIAQIIDPNKKYLVFGQFLGLECKHFIEKDNLLIVINEMAQKAFFDDIKCILLDHSDKAKMSIDSINQMLSLTFDEAKDKVVYIRPSLL